MNRILSGLLAGGALIIAAGVGAFAQNGDTSKEWPTYGHDPGGMRFSPLKELTPANVNRLKVAWVYHMKPAGYVAPPGGRGPVVMEGRGPGGSVGDTPDTPPPAGRGGGRGRFGGSGFRPSGDTPLVINGIMYLASPYGRAVALDPTTGKELWTISCPPAILRRAALSTGAATGRRPRRSCSVRAMASCIRWMRRPASRTTNSAITASST